MALFHCSSQLFIQWIRRYEPGRARAVSLFCKLGLVPHVILEKAESWHIGRLERHRLLYVDRTNEVNCNISLIRLRSSMIRERWAKLVLLDWMENWQGDQDICREFWEATGDEAAIWSRWWSERTVLDLTEVIYGMDGCTTLASLCKIVSSNCGNEIM